MLPAEPPSAGRGLDLLLAHCALLTDGRGHATPARERLEAAVGPELARLLVEALRGGNGRRERFRVLV